MPESTKNARPSTLELLLGTDRYLESFRDHAYEGLDDVYDCLGAVATILNFQARLAADYPEERDENGNLSRGLAELLGSYQRQIGVVKNDLQAASQKGDKKYPEATIARVAAKRESRRDTVR